MTYREPISLADVAAAVGLTPGHLTTVVRRKTGRTAQRWITERRMTEARRLLRETDLTIDAVAAHIGYVGYGSRASSSSSFAAIMSSPPPRGVGGLVRRHGRGVFA